MKTLTKEQEAANYHTFRHIERLRNLLNVFIVALLRRGELHDQSKLEPPEVELFTEHTSRLAGMTFGSAEYNEALKDLGPALNHHYANNRHHPEYHQNGIWDMNLVDLMEMLADWQAASERHDDGCIRKSIKHNADRFGLSQQLVKILENTVPMLEKR